MPRASGPTIARWQLGRQLKAAREAAKITQSEIADVLGCSESKIYKLEAGDVGINRGDLIVMLDRYGITDEQRRATIFDLQKQGKQRGWWAKYGQLPNNYSMYVGLESAAIEVKNFELAVVPGLLQTEEYARTILDNGLRDPEEVERQLAIRMERQAKVLNRPDPPTCVFILDFAALRCPTPAMARNQLTRLLEEGERPRTFIHVIPEDVGMHPGRSGTFSLATLEGGYVAGYMEDLFEGRVFTDNARVTSLDRLWHAVNAVALNVDQTRDLIKKVVNEL